MIRHALAGEWMKFWRNRPAAFWAFQFTPLLALAIGLSGEFLFRLHADRLSSLGVQSSLSQQAAAAFGDAASPLTQLFCLVGVATLFAAEHQWGTWRLLVTRQPRATVMLAKICVYLAGCVICTGGIGAAGVLSAIVGRVVDHRMDGLWSETGWIDSARACRRLDRLRPRAAGRGRGRGDGGDPAALHRRDAAHAAPAGGGSAADHVEAVERRRLPSHGGPVRCRASRRASCSSTLRARTT